jgi:hypothetical protein
MGESRLNSTREQRLGTWTTTPTTRSSRTSRGGAPDRRHGEVSRRKPPGTARISAQQRATASLRGPTTNKNPFRLKPLPNPRNQTPPQPQGRRRDAQGRPTTRRNRGENEDSGPPDSHLSVAAPAGAGVGAAVRVHRARPAATSRCNGLPQLPREPGFTGNLAAQ